jgi:DNA replication initiation complex subunit (GINS family)
MDIKDLREIHRKERMSPYLSHVGRDFYREVKACIREMDARLEEAKGDKSRLAVLLGERETLKNTIMDIFEIRERKIVTNALYYAKSGEEVELENLTTEEAGMLRDICDIINGYRKDLLEGLLSGEGDVKIRPPPKKERPLDADRQETEYLTVRILQDLPPLSGIDGKVYGPFKTEDVVTMPRKNASILLGKETAEAVHQG